MRRSILLLVWLAACASDSAAPGDGDKGNDGGNGGSTDGSADGGGGGGGDATGDGSQPAPAPGCPANIVSDATIKQALPMATVSTDLPKLTGKTTPVKSGDALQAAIDAAQPGDTLELEAGATFTGPITLPNKSNKSGSDWIVIRTATPDAQLAMPGARVSPALAPKMPKIVAGESVITVAKGAHHWRLIGLEVTATPGTYVNAMIDLTVQTATEADLAHDIIIDRVYLHADPVGGRRGVALNSKASAVIDSHLSGFREMGADSQAIAGWNGPGPYRIVNNYLEAASENIIFGGADSSIPNLVPADIQICGNHLKKDVAWKGGGWVVKNLFELKNARRVLVAGNVMEYNWADGQVGFAVLFTPRNQDGAAPWSGVEDVTFAYNIVRHTSSGLNMLASDDLHPSIPLARAVVHDNLFDDLDPTQYGGDGRAFQIVSGGGKGNDLKIDHNTTTTDANAALTLGDTAKYATNFVFTNNLVPHGSYGVFGSGQAEGQAALGFYLVSFTFDHNGLFGGGDASAYPMGNSFPPTQSDVGFATDWSLAASSTSKGAGSDGKDLGADIAAILAATKNAAP
jgi:hypothetical protein